MTNVDPNLRKAAVLLRSLDADTAAVMLGQLSAEEAATIRAAMRAVGQVDSDEQANVVAELRGMRPKKQHITGAGAVELDLSSSFASEPAIEQVAMRMSQSAGVDRSKQFEFLENAPTHALVTHLSREHAQTIAVVLSHLPAERAAAVLAALPRKVQAETVERLSALGETDPECVSVVKRELENWATQREGARSSDGRRRDTMAAILAAADAKSRTQILSNMKDHKAAVSGQFSRPRPERPVATTPVVARQFEKSAMPPMSTHFRQQQAVAPPTRVETRLPTVNFDDLVQLDSRTLSAVLRQVDADVLALALVGSREELVDRICEQMPKRTAREFRRQLRKLGPTRLSDVEGAQRVVAQTAAQQLADQRHGFATSRM